MIRNKRRPARGAACLLLGRQRVGVAEFDNAASGRDVPNQVRVMTAKAVLADVVQLGRLLDRDFLLEIKAWRRAGSTRPRDAEFRHRVSSSSACGAWDCARRVKARAESCGKIAVTNY